MITSAREEALAKELYSQDMGSYPGEYVPWNKQISHVQDSYRKQAARVVKSRWFARQLDEAALLGAYKEAVTRDEENSHNRIA